MATIQKMTVQEGLSKIKMYEKQISNKIQELSVCTVVKESDKKSKECADFKKKNLAILNSIKALLKNRVAIKSAISQSNAVTKVTISGVEYTVAEAIDYKHIVVYYMELKSGIECDLISADRKMIKEAKDLKKQVHSLTNSLVGKESADESSIEVVKSYEENNKPVRVDCTDLDKLTKEVETLIETFNNEVDFKLSTSNATTVIEVELD